jgi:hypothetical protein
MERYLVTYDLVGTDANSRGYEDLIAAIKAYAHVVKVQYSVWLLKSNWSAEEVFKDLRHHMHPKDRLYVTPVYGGGHLVHAIDGIDGVHALFDD